MIRDAMRREWPKPVLIGFIFALALLLRLIFAWQWQQTPYGDAPLLDAKSYDDWALSLAQGVDPPHVYYQSPLYPWLISFLYRAVGHSYVAVSLFNALLDSTSVVLLTVISWSLFGRMAGRDAGILAALYTPMVFFTAPVMKESLTLFLLTLFLFAALRVLRGNALRDYAACGVAFGLAVIARGNAVLLLPLLPVFAVWHYRHKALPGIVLFLFCVAAPIIPVALHNAQMAPGFVPVSYADGFNLYIGHSPAANGVNAYPPQISTDPEQERLDTAFIAQQESGHELSPAGISAFWRGKAVDYIAAHPGHEMVLLARKLFALWNGNESYDDYDGDFIEQNFSTILSFPLLMNFSCVGPLAIFALCAGCWRLQRGRERETGFVIACAAVYMISVLIFYVTDRYRLPMLVFLLPLAGAMQPCWEKLKQSPHKKQLAGAVAAMLAALGLSMLGPLDKADNTAFDWGVLTAVYADKGQRDQALDSFHKGERISARRVGLDAYIRAAEMLEKAGHADQAERLLTRAAQIYPQNGVAFYNLGRMQALRGDIATALATMQEAQRLTPTYMLTYYGLARLYDKTGDHAAAQQVVRAGLSIDPQNSYLLPLAAPPQAR